MSTKAKISKAGNLQLTQEALEQRPLGCRSPDSKILMEVFYVHLLQKLLIYFFIRKLKLY